MVGRFLAGIILDVKDFSFSLVKPFVDLISDTIDAHKALRRNYERPHNSSFCHQTVQKLQNSTICHSRPRSWSRADSGGNPVKQIVSILAGFPIQLGMTPLNEFLRRFHKRRFDWSGIQKPLSKIWTLFLQQSMQLGHSSVSKMSLSVRAILAFLQQPIIAPAMIMGIPLIIFGVYRVCRKRSHSLCVSLFCITTIIGKAVRKDGVFLWNYIASALRALQKKLPDKLMLLQLHIPSFNAKHSFAHFIIPSRFSMPVFSFRMPHLSVPHLSFPSPIRSRTSWRESSFAYTPFEELTSFFLNIRFPRIALPTLTLPCLSFPALSLPRITLLHLSFPRRRESSSTPIMAEWIPKQVGNDNPQTTNSGNFIHFFKHKLPKKISFLRKHYVTEFVILLIFFGTIGVFMGIYADTTSNRANMPIVYQGRLMDASYIPKSDSTYYLAFEIYTTSGGNTCKWRTETTQDGSCAGSDLTALSATTSRGLFTVTLGAGASDNPTFGFNFDATASYLQVYVCPSATPGTVAGAPCETLTPRKQIGGVTYSYNSDLLDGINYDGFLQLAPIANAQSLTFSGDTGTAVTMTTSSLTSGKTLSLVGPSSGAAMTGNIASLTSNLGNAGELLNLAGTFNTSTAADAAQNIYSALTITSSGTTNIGYNTYLTTTNSNSTNANTVYGIYNALSDNIALGNTNYGAYTSVSNTGNNSATSTKTVYGEYISAVGAGSADGTTNSYGLYITGRAVHASNAGTTNYYGLYIADDTAGTQTNGTSTKYGLYVATPTTADTNYAAIFAGGNVGIGTATPLTRLDISGNIRSTGKATAVLTGTIDPAASTTVTGVSTLFTTELVVGDRITVTGETRTVTAITNNTSLTVNTAFTDNANDTAPDVLYALATIKDSSSAAKMTINDSGVVLINGIAAYGRFGELFEVNNSANYGGAALNTWSAGVESALLDLNTSKSNTIGAHSSVAINNLLGIISFRGSDGTGFINGAQIIGHSDGDPSTNDMPGRLSLWTTPDGASTTVQRMTILNSGVVTIGGTTNTAYGRLGQLFEVNTTDNHGGLALQTWSSTSVTHGSLIDFNRSKASTIGTYTAVADDDVLGQLIFRGSDGTSAFQNAATIRAYADIGTQSATSMPGRLLFYTSADGSVTPTQRLTILSSGVVTIGGTTNTAYGRLSQLLEENQVGAEGGLTLNTWWNSANASVLDLNKSRGGAIGTHVVVQNNDALGNITFRGSDGAAFRDASGIAGNIDGATISSTSMPGRLVFFTTASGSVTLSERMRIDSSGNVIIGTAALGTTATDGFLYIPTSAGKPTGTPTTYTGRVPMEYDTTNEKLCVYNSGWKCATFTTPP